VGFAAAVSRAAAELGLTPYPSRAQSIGIYVAQHSLADVRPFFTAALGYEDFGDTDAVDPFRCGPQLAFNPIAGDSPARGRTHFDVFVPADIAQARVDAALAAGGRLADDSHAPDWWSLASPENHGVDIASWTDTYD
jgi:4a-hydroxytetrahydrobiopterin dehydratase